MLYVIRGEGVKNPKVLRTSYEHAPRPDATPCTRDSNYSEITMGAVEATSNLPIIGIPIFDGRGGE